MNPQNDSENVVEQVKKTIQEWLSGFKARPSKIVRNGQNSRHSPFTKPKRKRLSSKERRRRAAQSRKDKRK